MDAEIIFFFCETDMGRRTLRQRQADKIRRSANGTFLTNEANTKTSEDGNASNVPNSSIVVDEQNLRFKSNAFYNY
jgi:hypothetical protein